MSDLTGCKLLELAAHGAGLCIDKSAFNGSAADEFTTPTIRKENSMTENIYAERNFEAQGNLYLRHIDRMTVEGLHSKSAIAGELAHRDAEIEALKGELEDAQILSNENGLAALKAQCEVLSLRKDALRAATVAFSLMVIHSTDELPGDAQQLAEWLRINAFHFLPEEGDVEVLFIDIIRKAIRQATTIGESL